MVTSIPADDLLRAELPLSAQLTDDQIISLKDDILRTEVILSVEPFAGRTSVRRQILTCTAGCDYAVAIPVCNEEAFLPSTLEALLSAMSAVNLRGAAVFVVNDTSDRSAQIIAEWLADHALCGALVDVVFSPDIRNAPHTRRLALDLAAKFAPAGALLTTDADSEVGPLWVRQALDHLRRGYDLVCEDVRLDAAGLAALPRHVAIVGEAERAYYGACDALWRRWTGNRAGAFAHRASGASLALSTVTYLELGRLPTPPHGEDAALCAAILERGGRVVTIADGGTRTSARLRGRAAGGCGEELARRSRDDNPLCDRALVPIYELRRLANRWLRYGSRDRIGAAVRPMRYHQLLAELAAARKLLTDEEAL